MFDESKGYGDLNKYVEINLDNIFYRTRSKYHDKDIDTVNIPVLSFRIKETFSKSEEDNNSDLQKLFMI